MPLTRIDGEENIRSLYKSLLSCADHQDEKQINMIHIGTPIEDALIRATKEGKVVLVTGNPGDGKTHLIRKVQEEFPKKTVVILDANEREDKELVHAIESSLRGKEAVVIAINEGILLDLCEKNRKKTTWAGKVIESILRPYVYDESLGTELEKILVLDLDLRNNLSPDIVEQAIDRVTSMVPVKTAPPLGENTSSLRNPSIKKRVIKLLDVIGQSGFHATMRDLLGFIAFLICGGEEGREDGLPNPYYINAFEGGIGPLFERVRELDPVMMPSPFLDDRLYMAEDKGEEWNIVPNDEYLTPADIDVFRRRKRRAFFEHKEGDGILRAVRGDVNKHFSKLRKKDLSPEYVAIQLLNRFFDSSKDYDNLVLWFGHQFWARPIRYVASRQEVSSNDCHVLVPNLPGHLRSAFKDHYPDHILFKHKEMSPSEGLVMDRRFIDMLVVGDRLSGFGMRSLEAQAKIATFYDRLAHICKNMQSVVQILRLDNLKKVRIGVNAADRSYYTPGV